MGLDEMVNAIEPDRTLRTGKEWPGVWTRDVSYSIILAMAALQPEVSRISLEHKITPNGRIVRGPSAPTDRYGASPHSRYTRLRATRAGSTGSIP